MKLATFNNPAGAPRIGAVVDSGEPARVIDLNYAYAAFAAEEYRDPRPEARAAWLVPADMRALFEGGDQSLEAARQALAWVTGSGAAIGVDGRRLVYPLDEVTLRAPIIPKKLIHTAGNFREHIDELDSHGIEYVNKTPWIVFLQNTDAIVGPDENIVYPHELTNKLDYELELAVVLKGRTADLNDEEATAVIGGYVIFNDITARDMQMEEIENKVFGYCKAVQTFCPLGPWIVTADEIENPHDLNMVLRVNGEDRQVSTTRNMGRTIPQIVSHYSAMGYSGGDVLTTGTVTGVAAFSGDPDAWYLKPGDVIECDVERVGVLRNYVV